MTIRVSGEGLGFSNKSRPGEPKAPIGHNSSGIG
jgi:hypothetical protein